MQKIKYIIIFLVIILIKFNISYADLPDITNITWNSSTSVSFEKVNNASSYEYGVSIGNKKVPLKKYKLEKLLDENNIITFSPREGIIENSILNESKACRVWIVALDETGNNITNFTMSVGGMQIKVRKLNTPTNVTFENGIGEWDEIENATKFKVVLYKENNIEFEDFTINNNYDFTNYIEENYNYKFEVIAINDEAYYANSEPVASNNYFLASPFYELIASAEHGEIEFNINDEPINSAKSGEQIYIVLTPEPEYTLKSIKITDVDNNLIDFNNENLSFIMPNSNIKVTVCFDKVINTYNIMTQQSAGGKISANLIQATSGELIKLEYTINSGYKFDEWIIQPNNIDITDNSFIMPSNDVTISAVFSTIEVTKEKQIVKIYETYETEEIYSLTVYQSEGGSISPDTIRISAGGKQKFRFSPDEGYEIEDVLIDGRSVGAVTSYTFKNVEESHSIKAVFKNEVVESYETKLINLLEPNYAAASKIMDFMDVVEDDWYYDSIQYVFDKELFSGINKKEFGPNAIMTRGMLSTVIYKLSESNDVVPNEICFSDVKGNAYYSNAINWICKNNIATGTSKNTFSPNNGITREQLAVILYNYCKFAKIDINKKTDINNYNDYSEISPWAKEAMSWAVGTEIIGGKTQNKLNPKDFATRAEVATILMRFDS